MAKIKKSPQRLIAALVAVLLIVGMIPLSTLLNVLAAAAPSYTVEVDSAIGGDIFVKLTNSTNPTEWESKPVIDGAATFADFVDTDNTYDIEITGMIGFLDYSDSGITLTNESISFSASDFTEMDKINVSGLILDESSAAYTGGGTVSFTGYTEGSVSLTGSGTFSASIYKNEAYTFSFAPADAKYVSPVSLGPVNSTFDVTNLDAQLVVKKFEVATSGTGASGTITATESNIPYGSNRSIVVTANPGFRIGTLTVDGSPITAAADQPDFTYPLNNITGNHNISVTFYQKTWDVTFTFNANGDIVDGSSSSITNGGKITANEGDSPSFTAEAFTIANGKATADYHISSVVIDTVPQTDGTFDNTQTAYTHTFANIEENHSVTVTFSINTYDITVSTAGSGAVAPTGAVQNVSYGGNLVLTLTPTDGYDVTEVLLDGSPVSDYTLLTDGVSYSYTLSSVTDNHTVEVTFGQIEVMSGPELDYYDLTPVSLISGYPVLSGTTRIYNFTTDNNDASMTFTVKSPYTRISLNTNSGNKSSIKLEASEKINEIYVYRPTGSAGTRWVKVPLSGPIQIIIDKTNPILNAIPTMNWTNQSYTVSGTVTDEDTAAAPSSGLDRVVWSKTALTEAQVLAETTKTTTITSGSYSFEISDEQNGETFYVYAIDKANNVSAAQTVDLKIDKTYPEITGFTFQKIEPPVVTQVINFLTLGTYYNDEIEVIITAQDTGISSGLNQITLYSDGVAVETKNVVGNSAKFTLTLTDFNNNEISATVTDIAGNNSVDIAKTKPTDVTTNAASDIVVLETEKPVISIVPATETYLAGTDKWYDGNVAFTVTVTDQKTGIQSVVIKVNGQTVTVDKNGKAIDTDFSSSATTQEEFIINTDQNPVDGENVIEVVVINNSNNQEDESSTVYIDTTNPDITSFTITKENDDALSKTLNFLTFGIFFNEKVKITVIADDQSGATSGVDTITLYADGTPIAGSPKTVTAIGNGTYKAEFVLPVTEITNNSKLLDVVLSAVATDNVTNITGKDATHPDGVPVDPTTVNSDLKDSGLMIETVDPTIDISSPAAVFTDGNGRKWYPDNILFTVTTGDIDSGIRSVKVKINDVEVLTDIDGKAVNANFHESETHQEIFKINTSQGTRAADGSYKIEVTVVDNAGNEYSADDIIFKDIDDPYITGFEFEATGTQEADGTDISVQIKDYGFYFIEETKVTVSAKDNAPTSTIKSITYHTVDINNGKSTDVTTNVENDKISFVVPANFKGQIYAKATDTVNNTPLAFVTPYSAIVESPEKHAEEEHIAFEKATTTLKDNKGLDLYASDTDVTITVTDTYSGLRKVEWSVVAPYDAPNNQSGSVEINDDASFKDASADGWNKTETDVNLVTEMVKTIKVNNDSNEIVVWVKITDRAGNISENKITFSIDKTAPTIDVSYNNNAADSGKYFKENRTATIVISEWNFNPADVVVTITNTDGVVPVHVGGDAWNTTYSFDTANPYATKHSATILYEADGDYTFTVSYKDRAQNANSAVSYGNSVQPTEFTIDKTLPTISVSYDNNTATNDKFFAANRTATIVINEHNFDVSRVQFTQTASLSGTTINVPTASWQNAGDVHTATISYNADGDYTFDVTMLDMAGNKDTGANFGTSAAAKDFTVDTTWDNIVKVEGVGNGEVFGLTDNGINADAEISITFNDINFDIYRVVLTRSRILMDKNNVAIPVIETDVDVTDMFVGNPTGNANKVESFKIAKMTNDISNDGLYELRIEAKDKAGNAYDTEANAIVFSVNRYGSVYTFNDTLTGLAKDGGAYTKSVANSVIITEYNPNALNSSNVEVTRDASPLSDVKLKNDVLSTEKHESEKSWYEYIYEIETSNFKTDGVYKISVSSKDSALHNSETLTYEPLAVEFRVDTTKPEITNITGLEKAIVNASNQDVTFSVFDAIGLKKISVFVNGTELKTFESFEDLINFNGSFQLEEGANQRVKFVIEDMAGNVTDTDEKDSDGKYIFDPAFAFERTLTISTNFFVRFYANKPLFFGSIGGVVLAGLAVGIFLFLKKKKQSSAK